MTDFLVSYLEGAIEIAKVWGADAPSYKRGLKLVEKSVPAPDQDVITMSVEASRNAIKRARIDPPLVSSPATEPSTRRLKNISSISRSSQNAISSNEG